MLADKATRQRAFQRQIERLDQRLVDLGRLSQRFAWARAVVFFGGLGLSGAVYFWSDIWAAALTLFSAVNLFIVTVILHRQVDRGIERYQGWQEIKKTQIARMQLEWGRIPALAQLQPSYEHPFEADLDLIGNRSLHHLLDTAVSLEGSLLLRDWLTQPQPHAIDFARQQALVRELVPLHLFRHKLILNATSGAHARKIWDAKRLLNWLAHPAEQSLRGWLVMFSLLAGLNWVLLALGYSAWLPYTITLYLGLQLVKGGSLRRPLEDAAALQNALQQLDLIFRQLEGFNYRQTPHLKLLCQPFWEARRRPSSYLSRLNRLIIGVSLRQNPFLGLLLNVILPWDAFFALQIDQVRVEMADCASTWLEAWFELEALSALANFAYLNPTYSLPEFLPDSTEPDFTGPVSTGPVFTTCQIGHPLLPEEQRVCNDFTLADIGDIALITGSNMAGKSTFLRTVGINLALAYAGGPVCAKSLSTRVFRLFTCIKVSDSVTDGTSYFYAEVKRLRALLTALESNNSLPLFFFIDEIFRGTNNRERLIGSRSYLQTLVAQHGVGLVSTHDLELTKLADSISQVINYHFRDDIEGDQMIFDYKLHTGACPTTNALKIMRIEGLPVEGVPARISRSEEILAADGRLES